MTALVRVTGVEHLGNRVLRVEFSDGLARELDFAGALPGILSTLDDDAAFAEVGLDRASGTVCWPNGIDLDPDVLHGEQSAEPAGQARLFREYRMQLAG
jgi:hypothetical protein